MGLAAGTIILVRLVSMWAGVMSVLDAVEAFQKKLFFAGKYQLVAKARILSLHTNPTTLSSSGTPKQAQ
jgi:hypothetical protein